MGKIRATTTYNNTTICSEDKEGSNFTVTYNGSTIATIGIGETKTLNCSNKLMRSNVVIGSKTLNCAKQKMATNVAISVISLFPSAPSSYNLINTYTSNQTWSAPEDGYFQIEVFGASGNGGSSTGTAGGGGGGGGGYSCSRIKMNEGDTIVLTIGAVGSTTKATINSSLETYSSPQVTSAANGGASTNEGTTQGTGGAGGVGSNGNHTNSTGGTGGTGTANGNAGFIYGSVGGTGGTGANGAPNGGAGASRKGIYQGTNVAAGSGSAGFFKIYRGDTNL